MVASFDVKAFISTLAAFAKQETAELEEFVLIGIEQAFDEGEHGMQAIAAALTGRLDLLQLLVEILHHNELDDNLLEWVTGDGDGDGVNPNVKKAIEHILESLIDLVEFGAATGGLESEIEAFVPVGDDTAKFGGLEIQIFATTQGGIRFLWDRLLINTSSPERLVLAIVGCDEHVEVKRWAEDKWTPNPLFRFHPERYRYTRKFAAEIAKRRQHGIQSLEELQQEMMMLTQEMNHCIMHFPRRQGLEQDDSTRMNVSAEMALLTQYCSFINSGKQIFDIPRSLSSMFKETDMDDIPLATLKSPFPCCFIHFGAQDGLSFRSGWKVDGAYIELDSEAQHLSLLFTSIPDNPSDIRHWGALEEPRFAAELGPDYFPMNIGDALSKWFKLEMENLDLQLTQDDAVQHEELKEIGAKFGIDVSVGTKARLGAEKRALQARVGVMRAALRLAINALCYLTAYPDDVRREWPKGTPDRLRLQATTGTEKERSRARNKLEALGYIPVHVCGKSMELHEEMGYRAPLSQHARHWRRGHWRQQAYGEKRSLRKLIWVMPVIVNAELNADGEELPGHMYLVS